MKYIKFFPVILVVFFVIIFIQKMDKEAIKNNVIIDNFPKIELLDIYNNKKFNTFNLAGDGYFLINFFASWCISCKAEHEYIGKITNVKIIGISWRDKEANIKKFLRIYGNPYNLVLLDNQGTAGVEFGIKAIPESFLFNKNGELIEHFKGPLTQEQIIQINKIAKLDVE